MLKKSLLLAMSPVLIFFTGCESMIGNPGLQKQQTESLRIQEAQVAQLSSRLNTIQDNNADITRQIVLLNQKITSLEQKSALLENNLNNVASIRQEIATEKQERKAAVDAIIDQVSKDLAKAINTSRSASGGGKSGPVGSGDFLEYKVESGATLNAIAKAYGVSVDDIRKANNLKENTILRIGQTLYIPKKK